MATTIFGSDAFRKRFNKNDRRRPINKALFETLSVNFAHLSEEKRIKLIEQKQVFQDKLIALMNIEKFIRSITSGTGQVDAVHTRFIEVEKIIQETFGVLHE